MSLKFVRHKYIKMIKIQSFHFTCKIWDYLHITQYVDMFTKDPFIHRRIIVTQIAAANATRVAIWTRIIRCTSNVNVNDDDEDDDDDDDDKARLIPNGTRTLIRGTSILRIPWADCEARRKKGVHNGRGEVSVPRILELWVTLDCSLARSFAGSLARSLALYSFTYQAHWCPNWTPRKYDNGGKSDKWSSKRDRKKRERESTRVFARYTDRK